MEWNITIYLLYLNPEILSEEEAKLDFNLCADLDKYDLLFVIKGLLSDIGVKLTIEAQSAIATYLDTQFRFVETGLWQLKLWLKKEKD